MRVLLIIKIRNRLLQFLRVIFVLSILFILIVHLWEAIGNINLNNASPQGQPVQVEMPVTETVDKEQNIMDSVLEKIKNYHRGK